MRTAIFSKSKISLIFFIIVFLLVMILSPSALFAAGATYNATGGANWNTYSGYGDHITATFNVIALPESSVVLTVYANDVDEEAGEIDDVYFIETDGTEHFLGYLSGQNNVWTTTAFTLNKDWIKVGTSSIRIEPDVNDSGWMVTVNKAQLVVDGGVSASASITSLTLDDYDNSGVNVSLNSTVNTFINTAGSYKIETNLIDSFGNNLGTTFYNFTTSGSNEVVSRTTNFTYNKNLATGTFTINAFLFDSENTLQSVKSLTFEHEQDVGITETQSVESSTAVLQDEEYVWVRNHPMTCYKVWINEDNNFEFVFWWEYKNNSWVKIYDLGDNEVFCIDMPYGAANFEANLPDGMYTVKTFHDGFEDPIQEFIIGKP